MDTKELRGAIKLIKRIRTLNSLNVVKVDAFNEIALKALEIKTSKLELLESKLTQPLQTAQKFDFGAECNCMPRITCEHCEVKEPQTNEGELIKHIKTRIEEIEQNAKTPNDLMFDVMNFLKTLDEFKALQNTNKE